MLSTRSLTLIGAALLLGIVVHSIRQNDHVVADSQSRRLCLDMESTSRPNTRLREAALRAQRTPQREQVWTALGAAWLTHIQIYASSGNLVNVLACADAAKAIAPTSLAADELRASVRLSSHQFSEALGLADELIARDPSRVAAWGIKADAHLERGEWSKATQATREAMRLWPGASSHARAAYLHWLRGDAETAKRSLIEAMRGRAGESPDFEAWLWNEIAQIYWHEGDLSSAERLFGLSLAHVSDYPWALLGQARVALARGHYPQARHFAEQARAAGAEFEADILLGDITYLAESPAAAEAHYRQAEQAGRRADPVALARFLAERKRDPQRALRLLDTVKEPGTGTRVREARAWAQLNSGHCASAKTELQALLALGTRETKRWLLAGAIETTCGDPLVGSEWNRKALALNPTADPILLFSLDIARSVPGES